MLNAEAIKELSKAQAIEAATTSLEKGFEDKYSSEVHTGLVALPADFKLHDLESFLPYRRHARGEMTSAYVEDFADYVAVHADAGAMVFVSDEINATAVLNLGDSTDPGHADNVAVLQPQQTAAWKALRKMFDTKHDQRLVAEFLEDWADCISATAEGSGQISASKAAAAIRKLTIESARKVTAEVKAHSESMSAFEQIQATSEEAIPEYLFFTTKPYADLDTRCVTLRLGVLTGEKLAITLRPMRWEEHVELMARELATKVTTAIGDSARVVLGQYRRHQ